MGQESEPCQPSEVDETGVSFFLSFLFQSLAFSALMQRKVLKTSMRRRRSIIDVHVSRPFPQIDKRHRKQGFKYDLNDKVTLHGQERERNFTFLQNENILMFAFLSKAGKTKQCEFHEMACAYDSPFF